MHTHTISTLWEREIGKPAKQSHKYTYSNSAA